MKDDFVNMVTDFFDTCIMCLTLSNASILGDGMGR